MGPDQAVLVDKLIQTRKDIAKKDEKVEFLEEHVRQLTEELQKKTKQVSCACRDRCKNLLYIPGLLRTIC